MGGTLEFDWGVMAEVVETHTGMVFLVGELAYKVKKAVVTDFLDFSTVDKRTEACTHEVMLNRRLAPDSYLGLGHFTAPDGTAEPVIVMRRHPDDARLATLVRRGDDVCGQLAAVAAVLARFHLHAVRGRRIDDEARVDAVAGRWQENIDELRRYAGGPVPGLDAGIVPEIGSLATAFITGRAVLFAARIAGGRIVDGHADLLADDIFCLPAGPELLDCLEFDDRLRYVDVVDDVAFLAMDLEYLGRSDLAGVFLDRYLTLTGDDVVPALRHFYIAYRAVVRAKVDCVRYTQGHSEAVADAARHLGIARDHLRAGAVRLIVMGGAPGTGKSTLARAVAGPLDARVVSTDDVRAAMVAAGELTGEPGALDAGLYSAENVAAVYDAVLRQAHLTLCEGRTVILDGTWSDPHQRRRARDIAAESASPITELVCVAPLDETLGRIETRTATTSQVTPEIATALAGGHDPEWAQAHRIDTTAPLAETVTAVLDICSTVR